MKRTLMACFLALAAGSVAAHDMFLVVPDHNLAPGASVSVSLYNGTFDKSENAVSRDRMLDVSIVDGSGETEHPAAGQWRDEGLAAILDFDTGDSQGQGGDEYHREETSMRTDEDGKVKVELPMAGRWYARLIHMVPVDEEGIDYESNWATLTFEVD